jgi:hypothetical protein
LIRYRETIMQRVVYFVGHQHEVAHHAAPLMPHFDVRIVSCEEVIQQASAGDLTIFFSEHFDRFRNAISQLKINNVATLYLIDGILEWRNAWENRDTEPACPYTMRPVLSHKVACIGKSQARTLSSWGNDEKIEVVGVARFDTLRVRWLEQKANESPDGSNQDKQTSSSDPFRLLVMTAKTPGFTDEQVATTKQSLLDLKAFFSANRKIDGCKIDVTWRLTHGLASEIGVKNKLDDLTGGELAEALANSDAVISTHSTAMIEAMLSNKPVAALDYHNCPNYLQLAWNISANEKIRPVIKELVNPPARKILFQESQLFDAIHMATSATERLSQLIHSMFAEVDVALSDSKQLQFPSNLLCRSNLAAQLSSANDSIKPTLDHTTVFEDVAEFKETDTLELQAQLSHARREVEHLKRETTRLESELGQAHDIFEQIHNHPIAGPIVRLREKFMQFFQRSAKQNATNNPVEIDNSANASNQ